MAHLKYSKYEKPSVAQHILVLDRRVHLDNLKLLRHVIKCSVFDSLEIIEIYRDRNCDGGSLPNSVLYTISIASALKHDIGG